MGRLKSQSLAMRERATLRAATLADIEKAGNNVFCWCNRCRHNSIMPVSMLIERLGPDCPVPEVGARMVCRRCGGRDVATRPSWPSEEPAARHG